MFTAAITKPPSPKYSSGITTAALGMPDYHFALSQYHNYVKALEYCGLTVTQLEADDLADSCFVEDAAVVFKEAAVITNPGAASRKKEIIPVTAALKNIKPLFYIKDPGTLDGGDILQVDDHFYIGLSARTNEEGATQLKNILSGFGYTCTSIPVKSVLHLKTGITCIGKNTVLSIAEFAGHPGFSGFHIIPVSPEEMYAANCLYINETLIMPAGYKSVKSKLKSLNYRIVEAEMSEFEKMDGGLTCLSLRF